MPSRRLPLQTRPRQSTSTGFHSPPDWMDCSKGDKHPNESESRYPPPMPPRYQVTNRANRAIPKDSEKEPRNESATDPSSSFPSTQNFLAFQQPNNHSRMQFAERKERISTPQGDEIRSNPKLPCRIRNSSCGGGKGKQDRQGQAMPRQAREQLHTKPSNVRRLQFLRHPNPSYQAFQK